MKFAVVFLFSVVCLHVVESKSSSHPAKPDDVVVVHKKTKTRGAVSFHGFYLRSLSDRDIIQFSTVQDERFLGYVDLWSALRQINMMSASIAWNAGRRLFSYSRLKRIEIGSRMTKIYHKRGRYVHALNDFIRMRLRHRRYYSDSYGYRGFQGRLGDDWITVRYRPGYGDVNLVTQSRNGKTVRIIRYHYRY